MEHPSFETIRPSQRPPREVKKKKEDMDPIEMTDEALLLDEVDQALEKAGYPLEPELRAMLQETKDHRFDPDTWMHERRGSGFANAGRYLSDLVNQERSGRYDPAYLFDPELVETWRESRPEGHLLSREDLAKIKKALASMRSEGSKILANMIVSILEPALPEKLRKVVILPSWRTKEKVHIGSCSMAEGYLFSDIKRGIGQGTVVVDEEGRPILYQKHAGEPSAITLEETVLNGVRLPAGSLLAIQTKPDQERKTHVTFSEPVATMDQLGGARFLRLTSLSVSPQERLAAFGMLLKFQGLMDMPDYAKATLADLRRRAQEYVRQQYSASSNAVA